MNDKPSLAVVALVSLLFLAGNAQAISVEKFVGLNNSDRASYVASLVEGAAAMLKAKGQPDQAQKAVDLFHDASPRGGVNQLALNLRQINETNNRNATNPNNRKKPFDIEDAMAMTLKQNGIIVTADYLRTLNRGFVPSFP